MNNYRNQFRLIFGYANAIFASNCSKTINFSHLMWEIWNHLKNWIIESSGQSGARWEVPTRKTPLIYSSNTPRHFLLGSSALMSLSETKLNKRLNRSPLDSMIQFLRWFLISHIRCEKLLVFEQFDAKMAIASPKTNLNWFW